MTKVQFIFRVRELGFTDYFIGELLKLRETERSRGIKRRYIDYLKQLGYKNESDETHMI